MVRRKTGWVVAAALTLQAGWAAACPASPVIATVCTMAFARSGTFSAQSGTYVLAAGQVVSVSQYQAYLSLVGKTWGGDGISTVGVPSLTGRFLMGAGTNAVTTHNYTVGAYGGAVAQTLNSSNLPLHTHTVLPTGVAFAPASVQLSPVGMVAIGSVSSAVGSLAATVQLAGVALTPGGGLTLSAATGASTTSPSGAALGTPGAFSKLYSNTAPSIAMQAGSISGSLSGTLSGGAPVQLSGTASTSLSSASGPLQFSGGPDAYLAGATSPPTSATTVPTLPPFVAMYQYIALTGLYPTFN